MITSIGLRARRSRTAVLVAAMLLLGVAPAWAVPTLQLYIEGATYVGGSEESWVTTDSTFRLWVIGLTDPPGPKEASILGVHLAAAVPTGEVGTITLTPTTTALVTDPSTPSAPSFIGTSADGAIPVLSDGSSLGAHGIYGTGTSFLEWALGDFTLTDSPIGDFVTAFPTEFPGDGEIKVYTVTITGFTSVHFDTFDGVAGERHASFAPFSHDGGSGGDDGGGGGGEIPWPSALALVLGGALGLGIVARGKVRR